MRGIVLTICAFLATTVCAEVNCMLWDMEASCPQEQAASGCGGVTGPLNIPGLYKCVNESFYEYGDDAAEVFPDVVVPEPGEDPPYGAVSAIWDTSVDFGEMDCYSEGDCVATVDPFWEQENPDAEPEKENYACVKVTQYEEVYMTFVLDWDAGFGCELGPLYGGYDGDGGDDGYGDDGYGDDGYGDDGYGDDGYGDDGYGDDGYGDDGF